MSEQEKYDEFHLFMPLVKRLQYQCPFYTLELKNLHLTKFNKFYCKFNVLQAFKI